jgi:hypothetical protein
MLFWSPILFRADLAVEGVEAATVVETKTDAANRRATVGAIRRMIFISWFLSEFGEAARVDWGSEIAIMVFKASRA